MSLVEVRDFQVCRIFLEVTLDLLLVVLANTVQVFGDVDLEGVVFLVPSIAIELSEKQWLAIGPRDYVFLFSDSHFSFKTYSPHLSMQCIVQRKST